MLSSGFRKVTKALLILLAAAWITTGANATSEGERAPGLADKRFVSTYLYAAVRPTTGRCLRARPPRAQCQTIDVFIDRFAARLAQNHPRHRAARSRRMARREGARGAGGRSHPQHQKRVCSSSSWVV